MLHEETSACLYLRRNFCRMAILFKTYTAISIKVVPKTREKVEYERERLIGKDYSFTLEYITIHRYSTEFKIRSCFLMNINRDYVSLETKFCSVCVFLIVTPRKLFALVFDFYIIIIIIIIMETLLTIFF